MVKGKKEKDDGGPSAQEQESVIESKRLKELAVSRGLLSRSKANPATTLLPTKTIRKCNGKDIVKKGNRKTKYLFAFPGLVAPIAGGKFGDLTHLDSRNPTLYMDFPQGRLKLSGTIVYPKNKYLTMHFVPGRGDIVCEDYFESIVVFPEAWWIGTKEENPEELKLPMPLNLQQEKHTDFDFTAGAGRAPSSNAAATGTAAATAAAETNKVATVRNDPQSPEQQFPVERLGESPSSVEMIEAVEEDNLPLRRSSRKSAEKLNYTSFLSSSDSEGSSDDESEHSDFKRKGRRDGHTNDDVMESTSVLARPGATIDDKVQGTATESPAAQQEVDTVRESNAKERTFTVEAPKGALKQATLSSFLLKADKPQAPVIDVIEIEDSPLKPSGGKAERPSRRAARRSIVEEESEDPESSDEGQSSGDEGKSSGDSEPHEIVGSGRGRGRGRGKGRGGSNNAGASGGRTSTPRKGDAKRRQSITEISSSSDDDEGG